MEDYKDYRHVQLTFEDGEFRELKRRAESMGKSLSDYIRDAAQMQNRYDQRVADRLARARANKDMDDEELGEVERQIRANEDKWRVEGEALAAARAEGEAPEGDHFQNDGDYYAYMASLGKMPQKH